jgi:Flavin containing amine oxidoreductase
MDDANSDKTLDMEVAIVGGGIAGAYCAWRLANSPPGESDVLWPYPKAPTPRKLRISLYEGSKRIGGRLMSVGMPPMKETDPVCELGGMRYTRQQKLVTWLVEKQMNGKTHTRPLGVNRDENIAYLRGRHLRRHQLKDSQLLPYTLDWAEHGKEPDDLLSEAIRKIVPEIDTWRVDSHRLLEKLAGAKFEGVRLQDWGIWRLLSRVMSPEAYRLVRDAGGYDTPTRNWNAASGIVLNYDFVPLPDSPQSGPEFRGIIEGFQKVPEELIKLAKSAGVTVATGQRLKSFKSHGKYVELTFENSSQGSSGPCKPVKAGILILAMPKRALELISDETEVQRVLQPELLKWVTPVPLFKAFLCYEDAWWKKIHLTTGRSVTDIPIRQCYYWAVEREGELWRTIGAKAAECVKKLCGKGTLMVYDDALMADFWAGHSSTTRESEQWLDSQPEAISLIENTPDCELLETVKLLQRQLAILHDLRYVPDPTHAVCFDWRKEPFGGGVNFWNVGADLQKLIPKMLCPQKNTNVYICGEAYSAAQGWVEGALETAEAVLQKHLGLHGPQGLNGYELPSIYSPSSGQQ